MDHWLSGTHKQTSLFFFFFFLTCSGVSELETEKINDAGLGEFGSISENLSMEECEIKKIKKKPEDVMNIMKKKIK